MPHVYFYRFLFFVLTLVQVFLQLTLLRVQFLGQRSGYLNGYVSVSHCLSVFVMFLKVTNSISICQFQLSMTHIWSYQSYQFLSPNLMGREMDVIIFFYLSKYTYFSQILYSNMYHFLSRKILLHYDGVSICI